MVDIIPAKIEMCDELAKIKKQVWETTYRGIYPESKLNNFNIKKESKKFSDLIQSNILSLYAAIINNKLIGYMAYGKSPRRPNSKSNEIVLLYILKDFQGQGIGRQLFNFAKEKLKQSNANHFIVYCNKYNTPALNFYQKMGCEILSIDENMEDKSIPQVKFEYKF